MESNTTLIVVLIAAGAAGVYFFFIKKAQSDKTPNTSFDNQAPFKANPQEYPSWNKSYDNLPDVPTRTTEAGNKIPINRLPPTTVNMLTNGALQVKTTQSYARGLSIPKDLF